MNHSYKRSETENKIVHLNLKDKVEVKDRLVGSGAQKTKIIFKDHETGKVLGEYENKVVVTGSVLNAEKVFDVKPDITIPTYNSETELDNSVYDTEKANLPIVCLFAVGDNGCGATPKDVYVVNPSDRIEPGPKASEVTAADFNSSMLMPFRWVPVDNPLSPDLRKYYYGQKTYHKFTDAAGVDKGERIAYYFKAFDTSPQLNLRYADGTIVTAANIYNYPSDQKLECFVEMRLRITRLDFRDYFEEVLGWDKARISTISLLSAWYTETADGDVTYKWYQDVYPYTKLNFPYEWLVDSTKGIDIVYQVYY